MDQRVRDGARAGSRRADVRFACPATVHPLPGGEAIVAAPAAGRFRADVLLSIGDRVRRRSGARPSGAASLGGPGSRDARGRGRRGASGGRRRRRCRTGARRAAARRTRRSGPSGGGRAAGHGVAEARLRAAEARLAQRDETLRTGGGAAAGQRVRAAGADRRTAGRGDGDARRFLRRRRAAVQNRQDRPRGAGSAGAGGRCRPSRAQAGGLALEFPGLPAPLELEPHHVHDSGVIDPATRALAAADGDRESGRTTARWPGWHRGPLHTRATRVCRRCRALPCSWKPAGRTSSCRSAASSSCAASSRSRRATATGRRQERRHAGRTRRHARCVRRAVGVGRAGAAGRRPRALR